MFVEKAELKVVKCYKLKRWDLWRVVFDVNWILKQPEGLL